MNKLKLIFHFNLSTSILSVTLSCFFVIKQAGSHLVEVGATPYLYPKFGILVYEVSSAPFDIAGYGSERDKCISTKCLLDIVVVVVIG